MRTDTRAAFTLVELSIVLVVIGLIIGGIMGGQSLLRTAQIRSVLTDLTTYGQAVGNFRTEFRALPGDMSNATSYWGVVSGYTTGREAGCYSADKSSGVTTCNGDGDGSIEINNPTNSNADGTETYLAWQHLADAGMVTGSFTGVTANSTATVAGTLAGRNAPAARITGLTYVPNSTNGCVGVSDPNLFSGCYYALLYFGTGSSTQWTPNGGLAPDEMASMDQKMDDGLPQTGQMRTLVTMTNCYSGTAYNLSNGGLNCMGIYGLDPIGAN